MNYYYYGGAHQNLIQIYLHGSHHLARRSESYADLPPTDLLLSRTWLRNDLAFVIRGTGNQMSLVDNNLISWKWVYMENVGLLITGDSHKSYQPGEQEEDSPIPSLGYDHADSQGPIIRRQSDMSPGARCHSVGCRRAGLTPYSVDEWPG